MGEQSVRARYAAFSARDIDGAPAAMHPRADWPNGWEGGRRRDDLLIRMKIGT